MRAIKPTDTEFSRIAQRNAKNAMAHYIPEAVYKSCLKWLIGCSTKTAIPGILQPNEIHRSLLDTQIISLLHGKKVAMASPMLTSFLASWLPGLRIKMSPHSFSRSPGPAAGSVRFAPLALRQCYKPVSYLVIPRIVRETLSLWMW